MKSVPRVDGVGLIDAEVDFRLLQELSSIHAKLVDRSRRRDDIKKPLQVLRGRVAELAARIEANTRRLAQAETVGGSERPEALRSQLDLEKRLHQEVGAELDTALDSAKRELEQIASHSSALHEQAGNLSRRLSLEALRAYRELARLGRVPFIVRLEGERCEGCHLRVPTAFVGEMERGRRLNRCPSCKRVFVLEGSDNIAA